MSDKIRCAVIGPGNMGTDPARELLTEMGRRGTVGGQEDMVEDAALTMARERGLT